MLSAAQANNSSGSAAFGAFIIASECASRIGAAARGGFHDKGFHPTGIVGAFAATLAAGYLYGLDREQLINAQGIVLSQAGGSLQFLNDGAWTKRNHPGWASACGQTAAVMAKHGFFGPRDPYFGRFGLYALHTSESCQPELEKLCDSLGENWEMRHIAFKPYPACHMTHAFADAALILKAQHQFDPDAIERIVAYVHPKEQPVICEPKATKLRPQNAYDAQFSVNYLIAASIVRGRFGLAELEPAVLEDPAILNLCARTDYVDDPDSAYPNYYSGALDIHLKDGRCLHHREQINRGAAENPMSQTDIENKFLGNATQTVSVEQAKKIRSRVYDLDEANDIQALCSTLSAEETAREKNC